MGGPYRWCMDRSVRWSVDPVRWTGPRTRGQCFRVTLKGKLLTSILEIQICVFMTKPSIILSGSVRLFCNANVHSLDPE